MSDEEQMLPGVGLDCGTMNFVAARRKTGGVVTRRMRDAFLDLPAESSKRMLKLSGVNYIEVGDDLIVVGDAAIEYANLFGREARRPLKAGMISSREEEALKILGVLVKKVLEDPQTPEEYCYFSIPAEPIDAPRDVVYHKGVLARIITECGYKPVASNEALAIIYSDTSKDGFSGIGISMGSGLSNVALAIGTVEGLSFSVARGGDWIDEGAALNTGKTASRICALKEKGINLMDPKSREEEAIAVYYKAHIDYVLDCFVQQFVKIKDRFEIPKPIPIVVAGGTSLVGGFMDFFREVFEAKRKKFPLQVSGIRAAQDPLNAVAHGLLIQAGMEYDEED